MSASALPPDITGAILLLLPAKSLGRFKSVSKTWNSLISDPKFIKNHLKRHQITKLILLSHTCSIYSVDTNQFLPYLNINNNDDDIPATAKELIFGSPPIQWSVVLGSCNGLVLAKDVNHNIFMINPTTRELWKVPPFAFPNGDVFVRYGFSYDSSTDDYKVVLLSFWDPQCEFAVGPTGTFVSVYSLRNNSWKRLPNPPYANGAFYAVVNQNFHWYVNSRTIVAFSFTTEEFNTFRLQFLDLYGDKSVAIYDVVAIGGKLGFFISVGDAFELWVMEEYGVANSWTRICPHEFKDPVTPVCLVEGSNRDMVLDDEGDILVFNMDEGRCRNVRIKGGPERFTVGGTYGESLESPKRILGSS
ncbi:hypothetical protein SSX86_001412 [Deinandra increscens subsp. villosa]|uniref:F-box domain-containing protein n=1 Tax=Deinandra increscens subsp. villosa TaxID=3103831 RepID=A0AAP0HAS7_9ASTR